MGKPKVFLKDRKEFTRVRTTPFGEVSFVDGVATRFTDQQADFFLSNFPRNYTLVDENNEAVDAPKVSSEDVVNAAIDDAVKGALIKQREDDDAAVQTLKDEHEAKLLSMKDAAKDAADEHASAITTLKGEHEDAAKEKDAVVDAATSKAEGLEAELEASKKNADDIADDRAGIAEELNAAKSEIEALKASVEELEGTTAKAVDPKKK